MAQIEFEISRRARGSWRRYVHADGSRFAEYKSHASFLGMPLLHVTRGINPETGRRVRAHGVVAIGRLATGGLAIGQASFGVIAIGQVAVGGLFGLGQAAVGIACVGQLAVSVLAAVGQLGVGHIVIGQLAWGRWVLAQFGLGEHVWSLTRADPEAVAFFRELLHLSGS